MLKAIRLGSLPAISVEGWKAGKRRAWSKEQGAKSKKPVAKSKTQSHHESTLRQAQGRRKGENTKEERVS
jgi:hypothetical protein